LFFDAPVPAVTARRLGCFLITEAMHSHCGLHLSSYDRLVPNQDTMPRGGFGNLIALPLQHEPRTRGHSVFVDEAFCPFPRPVGLSRRGAVHPECHFAEEGDKLHSIANATSLPGGS